MYKNQSIAAVIPCFNEAPRIHSVLKPVLKSLYLDEVIVVDDASTDNSVAKVLEFDGKISLIRNKKNLGKAGSVFKGIFHSTSDIIFLIDADLIGLKPGQIDESIVQFTSNHLDMLLVPITSGSFNLYTQAIGWNILATGQRLISKKAVLHYINKPRLGFGLEMYLNKLAQKRGWKTDVILWRKTTPNPKTPSKIKKFGLLNGLRGEFKMLSQILKYSNLFDYLDIYNSLVIKKAKKTNRYLDTLLALPKHRLVRRLKAEWVQLKKYAL